MSELRVLEIISGFAVEGPLGGIERFGIELATALDKSLVTPVVCGMWAYDTPYEYGWVDYLQDRKIDAFISADWDGNSPYQSFVRSIRGTRAYLQGQQFDIIHSHCQFGDGLAVLMARTVKAKALVRTVHNEKEWPKRPERRLLLTNVAWPIWFDVEMGVAQQVVDNLDSRPLTKLLNKRAVRAYNALNVQRFAQAPDFDRLQKRAEIGIPADAVIVGSVGRLALQKGYDYLIQAADLLQDSHPQLHFMIVGSGDLRMELEGLVQQLKLEDCVHLLGARSDIEELLPLMDVFVNSSRWEGLPTVILESMAAGVPVVATEVSGNRELVIPGKTGTLVEPDSPAALARAIVDMLALPAAERQALTAAAQTFVSKTFSISSVARQHEAIYAKLAG